MDLNRSGLMKTINTSTYLIGRLKMSQIYKSVQMIKSQLNNSIRSSNHEYYHFIYYHIHIYNHIQNHIYNHSYFL